MSYPRRIVCLSDETVETLYLLGADDRIVGVSGFTTRPPQVRSKPRVSTFTDANVESILALHPDLVLTFSDVQANITRQLALSGLNVMNFNQRSVAEILDSIRLLARIVDKVSAGETLAIGLQRELDQIADASRRLPYRPRTYFEEWHDPLITGIRWVEELIEIAGGTPLFPEYRECSKARDRIASPAEVIARDPEIILASWCGMKVEVQQILDRPGWTSISAVRAGHIYEIPSSIILQPGPAALTEGVRMLHEHISAVANGGDSRPGATVL